ncbi:MAG: sensor histidine kinase [Candidatus Planktophila sp.]
MKRKSFRTIFASALITTALSLFVGGFATISVKNSQISNVDRQLETIASFVRSNPEAPVSAVLDISSEQDINITIALVSLSGELTIINESRLAFQDIPSKADIESSKISAVTVSGEESYRLITLEISGGDRLLLAQTLKSIESEFAGNLARLAIFTILADLLAITLSYLVLRRNNRKLEADSLARMQRFLADASHELRTPLTVIKGYSDMLSKGQISVQADRDRAFSRVNSEIIRMENLIHDLLLLAELGETRTPVREEIDLTELVSSFASDFRTLNPQREILTEIQSEVTYIGSGEHLRRLVQNVLNNISRHTQPDAPVNISLTTQGKRTLLTIEDGGPGLPEGSYRDGVTLLNRFDASRSRESGGSGLGLSIIAAIVHEHAGSLALRKSSLGGLAVEISL